MKHLTCARPQEVLFKKKIWQWVALAHLTCARPQEVLFIKKYMTVSCSGAPHVCTTTGSAVYKNIEGELLWSTSHVHDHRKCCLKKKIWQWVALAHLTCARPQEVLFIKKYMTVSCSGAPHVCTTTGSAGYENNLMHDRRKCYWLKKWPYARPQEVLLTKKTNGLIHDRRKCYWQKRGLTHDRRKCYWLKKQMVLRTTAGSAIDKKGVLRTTAGSAIDKKGVLRTTAGSAIDREKKIALRTTAGSAIAKHWDLSHSPDKRYRRE